jgi:hypothetical protein
MKTTAGPGGAWSFISFLIKPSFNTGANMANPEVPTFREDTDVGNAIFHLERKRQVAKRHRERRPIRQRRSGTAKNPMAG